MSFYAFKGFDEDLKCRDFQYEIGKTYMMDCKPIICEQGFHCCLKLSDVFAFYPPIIFEHSMTNGSFVAKRVSSDNRYCLIEVLGDVDRDYLESKIVTNKIKIVSELMPNDILRIINDEVSILKNDHDRVNGWLLELIEILSSETEKEED